MSEGAGRWPSMRPGPSGIAAEHHRLMRALGAGEPDGPERVGEEELQGSYDPQTLAIAERTWRRRMLHEHESAAVFAAIVPQLMEAGATMDFKTTVLRCAVDELRHAALCQDVVEFLGGQVSEGAEGGVELEALPAHEDTTRRVAALRNLLFASLTESISMGLLTEERERVQEPYIGRVLRQLVADESRHARVGWTFLAVLHEELTAEERDAMVRYMPVALRHLERELLGAMPLGSGPKVPPAILEELFALGFSESGRGRTLLYQSIQEVLLPRLDAFGLRATEAWDRRG